MWACTFGCNFDSYRCNFAKHSRLTFSVQPVKLKTQRPWENKIVLFVFMNVCVSYNFCHESRNNDARLWAKKPWCVRTVLIIRTKICSVSISLRNETEPIRLRRIIDLEPSRCSQDVVIYYNIPVLCSASNIYICQSIVNSVICFSDCFRNWPVMF